MFNHLLITGRPRVGKTTLIIKAIKEVVSLKPSKVIKGFVTSEIKENSKRIGFNLETMDGKTGILARVEKYSEFKSNMRVGKYFVLLKDLESFIKEFYYDSDLLVIDEIGKMELYSKSFKESVGFALEHRRIFGTISRFNHPFIQSISERKDVRIVELTKDNRNIIGDEIMKLLMALLGD
ncbi:MAG: nucleoside-triphosphatase [Candidatus Hodarchaeales archaeon]